MDVPACSRLEAHPIDAQRTSAQSRVGIPVCSQGGHYVGHVLTSDASVPFSGYRNMDTKEHPSAMAWHLQAPEAEATQEREEREPKLQAGDVGKHIHSRLIQSRTHVAQYCLTMQT